MASPSVAASLPRIGFVLLAFVTLGWGINWPIMKFALSEVHPLVFSAITTPFGGLLLLLYAGLRGRPLGIPRAVRVPFAAATLFNVTLWFILIAYGVSLMTSGRAVLIAYTMPLWASLLGLLVLGERMSIRRALGLAAGIAAIAVLMGADMAAVGGAPVGALIMVGAAMSWAGGIVMLKRTTWNMPVEVLSGWQLVLGSIPIALLAPFGAFDPLALSPAVGWAIAYNVFVSLSLGIAAWFRIVALFPVAVASIGTLLLPIVGVVSGSLMLGEPIGWHEGGAMGLSVLALALVLFDRAATPAKT